MKCFGKKCFSNQQMHKLEAMASYPLYISALQKNLSQYDYAKYVLKNEKNFSSSTIKEALYIIHINKA